MTGSIMWWYCVGYIRTKRQTDWHSQTDTIISQLSINNIATILVLNYGSQLLVVKIPKNTLISHMPKCIESGCQSPQRGHLSTKQEDLYHSRYGRFYKHAAYDLLKEWTRRGNYHQLLQIFLHDDRYSSWTLPCVGDNGPCGLSTQNIHHTQTWGITPIHVCKQCSI